MNRCNLLRLSSDFRIWPYYHVQLHVGLSVNTILTTQLNSVMASKSSGGIQLNIWRFLLNILSLDSTQIVVIIFKFWDLTILWHITSCKKKKLMIFKDLKMELNVTDICLFLLGVKFAAWREYIISELFRRSYYACTIFLS